MGIASLSGTPFTLTDTVWPLAGRAKAVRAKTIASRGE